MKRSADKQQQITALWPERVKKTRTHPDSSAPSPSSKRQKLELDHPSIPSTPKPQIQTRSRRSKLVSEPASIPTAATPTPTVPATETATKKKSSTSPIQSTLKSAESKKILPAKRSSPSKDNEEICPMPSTGIVKKTTDEKAPSSSGADVKRQKTSPSQAKERTVTFAPLPPRHSCTTSTDATTAVSSKDQHSQTQPLLGADASLLVSDATPPLPPPSILSGSRAASPRVVLEQKKKWRLSELIKKDREAKRLKSQTSSVNRPSFVFIPTNPEPISAKTTKPGPLTPSTAPKSTCSSGASSITHRQQSTIPGAEALLHDRSMLPDSYSLLLDVLTSMETAFALLRTRQVRTTVGAVREIVQRDTRRDFTLRLLAQLAALVPECVAVTEPRIKPLGSADSRPSDHLFIRLDDPESTNRFDAGASEIGDGPARIRRAFLHRRLLQVVREKHAEFVKSRGKDDENRSAVWHPEFDPNRDVEPLPAPPLCDENGERIGVTVRRSRSVSELLSVEGSNRPKLDGNSSSTSTPTRRRRTRIATDDEDSQPKQESTPTTPASSELAENDDHESDDEGDATDGIPKGLLAKVRSRAKAKEQRAEIADEEKTTNRSLLSKLPCTMDSINTVLRTERRSAMGWKQLVQKVGSLHPKKWPKEDIEKQMDAIAKLATDWCSKVELKSSRGGFAFRIVSDKAFPKARTIVSSTKSLSMD